MALKTNAPKLTPALPDVAPAPTVWWDARTRDELRQDELRQALADTDARLRSALTILSEVGRIQRCACTLGWDEAHKVYMHDADCFVSKVWRFLGWL